MWPRRKNVEDRSTLALQESKDSLEKTELRTAAVSEISDALRTLRERNHFAEQLESIMGGPR